VLEFVASSFGQDSVLLIEESVLKRLGVTSQTIIEEVRVMGARRDSSMARLFTPLEA
jgi:hypothetical protein